MEIDDKEPSDSQADAPEAYEKWKFFGSAFPFRWAFTGMLIIAFVGATWAERIWPTPYRYPAIAAGLLFVFGLLNLFHDIPRRRLGRASKAFLSLGIIVLVVLFVFATLRRVGAACC